VEEVGEEAFMEYFTLRKVKMPSIIKEIKNIHCAIV